MESTPKDESKLTIKLPWNHQHFENGYKYHSIERNDIEHILPQNVIKNMTSNSKLML